MLPAMAAPVAPAVRVVREVALFLVTVAMAGMVAMAGLVAMAVAVGFLVTAAAEVHATVVAAFFVTIQSVLADVLL